ncbi:hypothetical protein BHE74_00037581 [Ensete ventricosum]|nr:hypothetical protein BHE74_00037581 [Ensete ventricosum]
MANPLRERHHEDKQARKMRNAQRLGWLSLSYGSTLATKLDGAQASAFVGAKQCTSCSVRQNSPREWWSPKLPDGRMQRTKLFQQDKYPGGIGPGSPEENYMQRTAHVEEEHLKTIFPQSSMDQASDEELWHDLE